MIEGVFFIQLVGFIAFGLSTMAFQFKSQKIMIAMRAFADLIWTAHYWFLGGFAPALVILSAAFRSIFTVFVFPRHRVTVILIAWIGAASACAYFYNDNWLNLLPLLAHSIYGVAIYFHENYKINRSLMASGFIVWIVVGFVFGSYAEIISSSIGLCSLCLGFYRHRENRPVDRKSEKNI